MDWQYIQQGYALVATPKGETGHWFGGEPYHSGARCPKCKSALLLLADIDCRKVRKMEKAKLFHSLDRLPLYYCWHCEGAELSYAIIDSNRIKILKHEGNKAPSDFPYENYPASFPRRPVSLIPIDYSFAKLLALYQEVDSDWLSREDQELIKKGMKNLRHSEFSSHDINRHQLGGLPRLIQEHVRIGCPNPKCDRHKRFFKDGFAGYCMKELAVIFNDPRSGLPMIEPLEAPEDTLGWNEFVQVIFWICEECLAITASNRCD
jgi:hypothetical protein